MRCAAVTGFPTRAGIYLRAATSIRLREGKMMMSRHSQQERLAAVTPTLWAGLVWLYMTEQPRDALAPSQGIGLPAVADRRFVFVPQVDGGGAAVIVHVTTVQRLEGPDRPRDVLSAAELDDIAAALMANSTVRAHVKSAPGAPSGLIHLDTAAHPSLRAAVTRYRAGCPVHHLPACGYIHRSADSQCRWFGTGFARMVGPPAPPPPSARRAETPTVAVHDGPRRRCSETTVAQLGAANARRRDHGAARAVPTAREALAALSRRPHRSAATEEALHVLQLRVDHPQLSLRELAAMHTPPLTKDSYAARLRRALANADRAAASPAETARKTA